MSCRRHRVGSVITVIVTVFFLGACATTPAERSGLTSVPDTVVFADDSVPIDNPDVYTRISSWYNSYLSRPWDVARWLERSERIFPVVEPILQEHDLPTDLKYIAVIESDLDPRSIGADGERGIWQFMSDTAAGYGLGMSEFVDERGDIVASTEAAAEYFNEAREEIDGDWQTIAASFNVGVDGVVARVERQNENDYWQMVFPPGTEDYVPKIIAAKLVMENAEELGIRPEVTGEPADSARVTVRDNPVYLTDVAEYLEVSFRRLWIANPHIWKPYLEPGEYRLFLPDQREVEVSPDEHEAFLQQQPYEQVSITADGEQSVREIAESIGIPADELATFNGVPERDTPDEDEDLSYWNRTGRSCEVGAPTAGPRHRLNRI